MRVVVFSEGPSPRAGRTIRALRAAGHARVEVATSLRETAALAAAGGPVWLVRAGVWPCLCPVELPAPSRTGRPLCAAGATRPAPDGAPQGPGPAGAPASEAALAWEDLLCSTGGDLDEAARRGAGLPNVDSLYLEPPLAAALAARLADGRTPADAIAGLVRAEPARVVRASALDVFEDPGLRVAQVVTSVQQGGAERVAIDLTRELPRCGVAARLFALFRPSRLALEVPQGAADLSGARGSRDDRLALLAAELAAWGADLAHAHLLPAEDLRRLREHGHPAVITVHNTRAGWPPDLESLREEDAVLLVACARAVERDVAAARLPVPARSVWNGIDARPAGSGAPADSAAPGDSLARADSAVSPDSPAPGDSLARADSVARAAARRALGFCDDALVLLAVSNPRPQKRLHLLPAVLAKVRAALARLGVSRPVELAIAGDSAPVSPAAAGALAALRAEVARLSLSACVRELGSVADVRPLLSACDVLVSPSAHEGLSLAHLEALAAGRPVVATGEGGTAEVAALCPALSHVPDEAGAAGLAQAVIRAALDPALAREAGPAAVAAHFTLPRMARGYARLYPRAAARAAERAPGGPRREGLVLVTNNFSTGGAQSSGRRLLAGLAGEGVRARAAVLEEQPAYPTPGRRALSDAGIEVLSVPPPREIEPGEAVSRLVAWMTDDPPEAVVFWNVIPEHKVLLADALFDLPVFDVSPGEMYFRSLERYFAAPRPGLPYLSPRDYGARLAGVIVKYAAEAPAAAAALGAPVHVVPNGVPLRPCRPARDARPLILGTAARIHPDKKLDELLSAVRIAAPRMPPFRLRIAGAPDRGQDAHAAELRTLGDGLPIDWLGEVEGSGAFLEDLDVFVMLAEPAGCPNASLEALAAGLPVVATDVGGMSEQVEDGVSGRLVPRADPAALAAALLEVSHDTELRSRLGRGGWQRVADRFSMDRMIGDYRRICLDRDGA